MARFQSFYHVIQVLRIDSSFDLCFTCWWWWGVLFRLWSLVWRSASWFSVVSLISWWCLSLSPYWWLLLGCFVLAFLFGWLLWLLLGRFWLLLLFGLLSCIDVRFIWDCFGLIPHRLFLDLRLILLGLILLGSWFWRLLFRLSLLRFLLLNWLLGRSRLPRSRFHSYIWTFTGWRFVEWFIAELAFLLLWWFLSFLGLVLDFYIQIESWWSFLILRRFLFSFPGAISLGDLE